MAWYSGIFGGDDEEQQQAAPKKSFLNSLLGGIGKILLYAAMAAAALVGVFYFSKGARDFADEKFNGFGSKTLEFAKDSWNTITDKLGFGSKEQKPTGAKTETINGINFPVPSDVNNAISANPKEFSEMAGITSAKLYYQSSAVSKDDGIKGLERLTKQTAQTLNIGLGLDMVNKDFQAFQPTDPNVPKPQTIDLKVPALTKELDEYGSRKFQTWQDASPLQKIDMLIPLVNKQANVPAKIPALENIDLVSPDAKRNAMNKKIDNLENITKLEEAVSIPNHLARKNVNAPITTLCGDDEELYNHMKLAIKTLHTKSRFGEAEIVATQSEKLLREMQVNIRPQDEKRREYYIKAVNEMGQIKTATTQLKEDYISPQSRDNFALILDKAVANIYVAAQEAPVVLKRYREQLDTYKAYTDSMRTSGSGTDTTNGQKKTDASSPDYSTLLTKAQPNGEKDLMATLPNNKVSNDITRTV